MPGEFYIKGKKEKTDLSQVLAGITQLEAIGDADGQGLHIFHDARPGGAHDVGSRGHFHGGAGEQ